jgi:hypothetical protein
MSARACGDFRIADRHAVGSPPGSRGERNERTGPANRARTTPRVARGVGVRRGIRKNYRDLAFAVMTATPRRVR